MKNYTKFLVLLLAITSYGYSSNNYSSNINNISTLENNVELNNLINFIHTKYPKSDNHVFILHFHDICVELINSFNTLANDIELAEKEHEGISQFGYLYDKSDIFKKLEEITNKNNIQLTYPNNVPELFKSFSQLIKSIYIKFIKDLAEKIQNIPADIYWMDYQRDLEYIILDCIELYAKQINNVILLSFEDMSYTFKRPLNDLKNKNMYPAVTSLYNLQVNVFCRKLYGNEVDSEIGYMEHIAESISPQNVKWFKGLQNVYSKYFCDILTDIADEIDKKYPNIYDKTLCKYNYFMIDYFYNKNDTFAYDTSFSYKFTFTSVIRSVILQFNYLIHDMYNKLKNAHDDNDVNEAKKYFIKKMNNIMNNLLQLFNIYSNDKKISNIITNRAKHLISMLNKQLQLDINKDILFDKMF